MGDNTDLERILARLDKNPFQSIASGKSKPIYAISDLKVDSTFFDDKTWNGLAELHKEMPGPVVIAGGLFDSCKYFFSKNETVKLARHNYESGPRETITDELEHKKQLATERLSMLGADAEIHYLFGPKDIKNITELYNEKVTEYVSSLRNACKAIENANKEADNLQKRLERIDDQYQKKIERASMTKTNARSRKPKGYDAARRQRSEWQKARTQETRRSSGRIREEAQRAQRYLDRIKKSIPLEEVVTQIEPIYQAAKDAQEYASGYNKKPRQTTNPKIDENKSKINSALEKSKEDMHLNSTYLLHKRDISKTLRHKIIEKTKSDYIRGIETILEEKDGPKINVHPWIQTATQINGSWVLATGFCGGFSDALRQRNYSRIRQDLFGQKTRGDWNEYIEDDEIETITGSIPDKDQFKLRHIDLVIAGNDNVFRWGPLECDPDVKNERPTDAVTLAPFYDVKKARTAHNREHIKTDETHFSHDPRSTSGFLIIDYDKESTTRMGWINPRAVESTIKLAKDAKAGVLDGTMNGMTTSDEHPGQVHVRYDNIWGVTALRLLDQSLEFMDLLGDAYQGHNYKGTHTEGRTKIARLDDQARLYAMSIRECAKTIIKRSGLKHPVAYAIGNHDKPVENDFGIDLIGLVLEQLNLELEDSNGQLFGFDALTPERIAVNLEYKKTELGYESHLDKQPIRCYWSGHNGYGRRSYDKKDGERLGTSIICHKSIMCAGGDKMDPVNRVAIYTKETGRITDDIRELKAGHIHIPMVGNISDGINVCVTPSSEAADKKADNPWSTESIFGIICGFTVPITGAWKSYVSRDLNGPIFYEFFHSGTTRTLYDAYIKPKVEKAWKSVPDNIKYNLIN